MATTAVDIVVKTLGGNRLKALNTQLKGTAANAVKAGAATDSLGKSATQLTGKLTKTGREIRKAANGLEFFIDKAGRARKLNGQFVTTAEAAAAGIEKFGRKAKQAGRQADKASNGFNKLKGAVRGLLAAFAITETFKFVFVKTAELETQARSLEVLTGSATKARDIIKDLQGFAAVTPFTSSELIDTAKRLKAFGIETENLVDTTKRLGDVAGATGADLSGIATAFGQINAKGKLQTEELLQLQERGVDIAEVLKKEYNLTGEEFSKALEKGQISADAANFALQKLTDTGGKYANGAISQSDTLSGKLSTLTDGVETLARTIGEVLAPALKSVLDLAIDVVNNVNAAFAAASISDKQKQGFKSIAEAEVQRSAGPLPGGPFGAGEVVVRTNGKTYKGSASSVVSQITNDLINEEVKKRTEEAAPKIAKSDVKITTLPPLLQRTPSSDTSIGTGTGTGGGGVTANTFKPSSRAQALIAAAKKLGVSPLDLATIISYETAGTFSPSIMGGAGGNYQGLIQFGPPERRQYGAHGGQSFEEQVMGPVVRFFKDRFAGVGRSTQGASLLDLYKTVNGGNPNVSAGLSDGNGTIGGHVQRMMGGHRQKALATFFGGSQENVGYSAMNAVTNQAAGFDALANNIASAREQLSTLRGEIENINVGLKAQVEDQNEINRLVMEGMDPARAQEQVALQRAILDIETERKNKLQELKGLNAEGLISAAEMKTVEEDINRTYDERKQLQSDLNSGRTAAVELAKQAEQAKELDGLYKGIGSTIENGIIGAIDAGIDSLINGTKDLGEALQEIASGVLKDIGRQLISFGVKSLLGSTGLPGFAEGGRPEIGKPSIVGEKGPELFIPDTAGTVVPNDEAFNDARNALIDTPARLANEEAEAFAVAAGALERNTQVINNRQSTTQQETSFNNFTEAMMRPGQSTVRFETVNVGDMPMVTRDEALKIGANSAKAAEANVFKALRNKPSVRRSIGMG